MIENLPLYRQLAKHYLAAITSGTLAPGDRMPALRSVRSLHQVSLSTALQTYRYLEQQGWLEARPRSGYFVCRPTIQLKPLAEPSIKTPDPAQYVGIHARISAILAQSLQSSLKVNLAGAVGTPELYPLTALKNAAIQALRRNPNLFGTTSVVNGEPGFCTALAKYALASGLNIAPDAIIVTHGCTEALTLALRAVAAPGDVIAVESPTYYGLLQILESLGMKALEIPTSAQTGISLEALELAAQTYKNIKAVVAVPNLQNPLNCIMPDAHKKRLVHWCTEQQIALIEDDSYAALCDSDIPLSTMKSWDRTGQVIYCASLRKTLAPGMRLGWMVAGKWHNRVEMLKYSQTRPNEILSQIAAAEVIKSGLFERHLHRLRKRLRIQREQVAAAIATYFPQGTGLNLPQGGLSLWVALPEQVASKAVFDLALHQGIRIAPGLMFSNSNRFDNYIRINCGGAYSRELDAAFKTLGAIVTHLA